MAKIMVDGGSPALEGEYLGATRNEVRASAAGVALAEGHEAPGLGRETGPEKPAPGGWWIAILLVAARAFLLAYLLSPGLRAELGRFAVFPDSMDAAGIKDWLLSFGALSPVVYFLGMVAVAGLSALSFRGFLVETVRKASRADQSLHHQSTHRHVDERLTALHQPFVIFAHPPVLADPRERPLHYPSPPTPVSLPQNHFSDSFRGFILGSRAHTYPLKCMFISNLVCLSPSKSVRER